MERDGAEGLGFTWGSDRIPMRPAPPASCGFPSSMRCAAWRETPPAAHYRLGIELRKVSNRPFPPPAVPRSPSSSRLAVRISAVSPCPERPGRPSVRTSEEGEALARLSPAVSLRGAAAAATLGAGAARWAQNLGARGRRRVWTKEAAGRGKGVGEGRTQSLSLSLGTAVPSPSALREPRSPGLREARQTELRLQYRRTALWSSPPGGGRRRHWPPPEAPAGEMRPYKVGEEETWSQSHWNTQRGVGEMARALLVHAPSSHLPSGGSSPIKSKRMEMGRWDPSRAGAPEPHELSRVRPY